MKKYIIIVAAVVAMAGCSKVESVSVRERSTSQIGFSTYTGRTVSKGVEGTQLQQSFNVEGFLSGTPPTRYFHATTYRYANNRFTGDTTRYWPETGESLDFYATSPLQYKDTSANLVDFKPENSTFTVAGIDGTTDILAARLVNRSYIDPVALNFGHKLTKIAFRATGYDPTKIYKIYSITVDANSSASYSFGTDSWNSLSDSSYTYSFLDEGRIIPAGTMTSVAVGDTLYLIPAQGATVTAKVRYAIYDGAVQIDTTTTPVEIELPVSGVWGVNKSVMYKLTLHFSSDATPIVFTADPSDWDADNIAEPIFHYVENGIDFGEGIRVGDVIWAPVNCGTDTSSANLHPNGLLYQFARAHGQGHDGEVGAPTGANIVRGKTSSPEPEKFYYDIVEIDTGGRTIGYFVWYAGERFREWPVYTEGGIGNPCPEGWRLPTDDEMGNLLYSDWDFQEHEGTTLRDGWVSDTTLNVWKFNDELVFSCPGFRVVESEHSLLELPSLGIYWTSSVRPLLQTKGEILASEEMCTAVFSINADRGMIKDYYRYIDGDDEKVSIAKCGYFDFSPIIGCSVRCVRK